MNNKLRLEDLKVGMKVKVSDLLGVYNTYLLVSGLSGINSDEIGELVYFGKDLDYEVDDLMKNGAIMMYFDEDEMTGEAYYDE